ncbi:MAG: Coenzyme F420 hydrogenase/dehydrogenase, beta subunit C-terminal domain [Planctomycetota bacterium]|nr:Coenzyme F420 hydrogenase/dehydrogenase, beta subunit C-terminal domain [Planctomycetota bacterium]
MSFPLPTIRDVAERQLCCGCGACAAVSPGEIRMVDDERHGRRPMVAETARDERTGRAIEACPGVALEHTFDRADPGLDAGLMAAWGPVRGVWEGFAADGAIRLGGSSGGAATALALHAVERGGMHGVLHTAAREDAPYLNRTVMSRTREEMLERTGSRYAPASPCEGLGLIASAPGPCVFIGKPCDVAGAQRARRVMSALDERLGLTIAFFCAGTPSTRGTLELLKKVGVDDPSRVTSLRYRGNGWPGLWTVRWTDATGAEHEARLTYEESWGFLQKYRQWRCSICPDHTGEFADVSVGDPWYRPVEPGEAGKSLIVARTPRGLEAVRSAARDGYLVLEREDAELLPRSQPNLLQTRGRLWGQLVALRAAGVPTPRYAGFETRRFWWRLRMKSKVQSTVGTLRRIASRGLKERVAVREMGAPIRPESTRAAV